MGIIPQIAGDTHLPSSCISKQISNVYISPAVGSQQHASDDWPDSLLWGTSVYFTNLTFGQFQVRIGDILNSIENGCHQEEDAGDEGGEGQRLRQG